LETVVGIHLVAELNRIGNYEKKKKKKKKKNNHISR